MKHAAIFQKNCVIFRKNSNMYFITIEWDNDVSYEEYLDGADWGMCIIVTMFFVNIFYFGYLDSVLVDLTGLVDLAAD